LLKFHPPFFLPRVLPILPEQYVAGQNSSAVLPSARPKMYSAVNPGPLYYLHSFSAIPAAPHAYSLASPSGKLISPIREAPWWWGVRMRGVSFRRGTGCLDQNGSEFVGHDSRSIRQICQHGGVLALPHVLYSPCFSNSSRYTTHIRPPSLRFTTTRCSRRSQRRLKPSPLARDRKPYRCLRATPTATQRCQGFSFQ